MKKILQIIFQNIIGVTIGVIGFISAFLSYLYKGSLDTDMISYRAFFAIMTLMIIIIILSLIVIIKLHGESFENKRISVFKYNKNIDEFLISYSQSLTINILVGLYYYEGDYDILIGLGLITNNTNKFCQLKIQKLDERFILNYSDIYKRILENDRNTLNNLNIKYQISNELLTLGE